MSFVDIAREPDFVWVNAGSMTSRGRKLMKGPGGVWAPTDSGSPAEVRVTVGKSCTDITVDAPDGGLSSIHLRWRGSVPSATRFRADHWGISQGDMEWRGMVPDVPLPWYFLAFDGERTYGCGVKTGASTFCYWQVDNTGVSLVLDTRCGGGGVLLGDRTLHAATVVYHSGEKGESAHQTACVFARRMCDNPRLPKRPIYGGHSYYWRGIDTDAEKELEEAAIIADVAPSGDNRPYIWIHGWGVNDAGYRGPWDSSNEKFPDMPALADRIRSMGVRPGSWIRLLKGDASDPESLHLPPSRIFMPPPDISVGGVAISGDGAAAAIDLDPSIPKIRQRVVDDVRRLVDWGYEFVYHDFSTYDILGRWTGGMSGYQDLWKGMITNPGWSFSDRSRTTAEIIIDFYKAIREGAGDAVVVGCNTIGHLGAGLFEAYRVANDNSADCFSQTRRMGLNGLAFRMHQHNAFHAIDPDGGPVITKNCPWEATKQWLQIVAESGSVLFFSVVPEAMGLEQKKALRKACAIAAESHEPGEPLDWMETTSPSKWRLRGREVEFDWFTASGVDIHYLR